MYPPLDQFVACPECDLLLSRVKLAPRQNALCPRCGCTIIRKTSNSFEKTLALSSTGLLLYFPALFLPLLTFNSLGFSDTTNLFGSVSNFSHQGYTLVALMALLTAVLFPLVLLGCSFFLSLGLFLGSTWPKAARLMRLYQHLEEWAMLEIFLLAILVTIIKMSGNTDIVYNSGVFCFIGLVLTTVTMNSVVDRDLFWRSIEAAGWKAAAAPQGTAEKEGAPVTAGELRPERHESTDKARKPGPFLTARDAGLLHCLSCRKLAPLALADGPCPRCSARLQSRKVAAIPRTWALILTAALLFAPANLLPIMQVDFLGVPDRSTILDGIIYFFQEGSLFIGLIILVASVLVPLFKIVGLAILLLSHRPCGLFLLQQKARMFRIIAFIGRWSMLDIFVIALLAALVDFGFFTTINVAPAATYFAVVVTLTMLAALAYDPRLMWDRCIPCSALAAVDTHSR